MRHVIYLGVGLILAFSTLHSATAECYLADWQPVRILGGKYPREARAARIRGQVKVECSVGSDGVVKETTVLSGHPVLSRTVIETLKHWKFKESGETKESNPSFVVTFNFKFNGSCHGTSCKEEFWLDYPNLVTIVSELPFINPSDKATH